MHAAEKYTSALAQAAAKYTSIQLTGILVYNALGQAGKYTSNQLTSILVCTSALGQAAAGGGRGRS